MDTMSWVALAQPLILCLVFAGLQQSGVFNYFNYFNGDSSSNGDIVNTRNDITSKLQLLEENIESMEVEFKGTDESITSLEETIANIQSKLDLLSTGHSGPINEEDLDCVSQDVLTHVAIAILSALQLVLVILMSVLWLKMSKLQMRTTGDTCKIKQEPVTDTENKENSDHKENNNADDK